MSEGPLDLRSLLLHSSEPQTTKSRKNITKNKSNTSKENRANKAGNKGSKSKKHPEPLPLDRAQVERFFNAAENAVFVTHRPPVQQPPSSPQQPAGIQDLALLNRLTISSPTKDCGSPMSIENHPQHGGGSRSSPFPQTTNPSPLPSAAVPSLPPPPPQQLSEQEIDAIARQRAAIDSDAMLASCPPHLYQVDQTFLKQAEAVKLADQCNAGLPVILEPELLLSKFSEIPRKPQVIGAAKPLQSNNSTDGAQLPPQQTSSGAEETKIKSEARVGGMEPSTVNKTESEEPVSPVKNPVHKFSFKFAEYRQDDSEKKAATEEDTEENDRKRARSDESAALMKQMQDKYIAALAQLNAPVEAPAGPAPLQKEEEKTAAAATAADPSTTSCAEGAAQQQQPTKSGDSGGGTSSHGGALAPPRELPRRTQEAIRVFCLEKVNERTGLFYRNFTATSYAKVWRSYITSRPGTLHWYEVVREGRPCHLYFDLEFARSSDQNWNTNVDGDALVDCLLHHVKTLLERNWGLVLDPQTQVYELESSTPEKFSRHVIVRIPGHAFFHNLAIGHFVAQVIDAAGAQLDVLKNPPPSEERVSFVDTAVYTKNRHFRLVYSSKGGKTATLQPTKRYATGVQGVSRLSPARIFNDTLICNVDQDVKLLAVLPPLRNALLPTGEAQLMSGGAGGNTHGTSTVNGNGGSGGGGGIHQGDVHGRTIAWKHSENETVPPDTDGSSRSEATFLKDLKIVAEKAVPFIEQACKQRSGYDARARTVAFCGVDGLVAYSMLGPGSHYCEHIGRPHKNNHVYFVANFSGGVYAQKCHDPDCSRFRSAWMPLPQELCLSVEEEEAPKQEAQEAQAQRSN